MNKRLRAKRRFLRDIEIKEKKKLQLAEDNSYDYVFQLKHFVDVLPKCLKGVSWKASVQNYYMTAIRKMYQDYTSIVKERKLPNVISTENKSIHERGKERIIVSIHIRDRVIQKVLCDYLLVPILLPKLIYDSGASIKNKGVSFARSRMLKHLKEAIKEYGTDFYVLSFDFKSFFDSIPHKTCRMMLERYIYDKEIVEITMDIIKSPYFSKVKKIKNKEQREIELEKLRNDEYCGICLGSQVSQIMALIAPNDLDHYIKDKRKIKHYIKYMDDGIILAKTKEELNDLYEGMKDVCNNLGLVFNAKKTHITKIRKGFTFLKVRYFVTDTGKIVRKLVRQGTVRMRRKLKKFRVKVDNGEIDLDNVYDSMQSWLEHAKIANSYTTVKNMMKLYKELFGGYKITKKWKNGGNANVQADKWAEYRWCCNS